ncbi:MAG: hypothetical protein B6D38_03620 [Anaerolineae bacterium UTCFX1]|jgi:uncharacterized protein YukE|nr:MAG: hypothetical protein B6D38_03620 [Anaerolineae bacterium UTCFX1]
MTTLHLIPSSGHQTASILKQNSLAFQEETQSLRRAIQALSMSWQGGGQEQFSAEANALLRKLEAQVDALQILASRLEREVTEWEQTDQRGAALFRGSGRDGLPTTSYMPLYTGGQTENAFLNQTILPVFTALTVIPFLSGLPAWLNSFLERFFVPPTIATPFSKEGETPLAENSEGTTRFGDLLKETAPGAPSAQEADSPSPADGYDVYYDIPPQSQGKLYGSAACLPTSMSMALDYFHAKDPANRAASPSDLIGMLDQGDGTEGRGVTLDKLNDDLGELGYSSTVSAGNMDDLGAALREGPVIINSKVGLVSVPARDITPNGSINHAILVKAINADSVVVNDPWSGKEKVFSRTTFEKIWKGGGNYMTIVRPQATQ